MFKELTVDGVKKELDEYIRESVKNFAELDIVPKLAVIRAGDDDGQTYYENAIIRQSENFGIETQSINFAHNTSQALLEVALRAVNEDESVHGVILLRPFPENIDGERLRTMLNPEKDVDAITDFSMADLFVGKEDAFFACTAEACMEIVRYHGIELAGKKVTVLGRSITVGKPIALMMLAKNATVTICHSGTPKEDAIKACRDADIVVLATGQTEGFGSEYFRDGQIILDVGTGMGADGTMHGDLNIEEIKASGKITDLTYTPVPGGIGRVTTSILLRNIIKAAGRAADDKRANRAGIMSLMEMM
jgi:methylenetetrahydrofolate dehydrogenase (NADP+)/methenyltetrahydrofolate cyclohydrolase